MIKLNVTAPMILIFVVFLNSCGSGPAPDNKSPLPKKNPLVDSNIEPVNYNDAAIPINPSLPLASWVAGRPGYVFNPYNQNMVEVTGLQSGTKVRDPLDTNPSNIFLIP